MRRDAVEITLLLACVTKHSRTQRGTTYAPLRLEWRFEHQHAESGIARSAVIDEALAIIENIRGGNTPEAKAASLTRVRSPEALDDGPRKSSAAAVDPVSLDESHATLTYAAAACCLVMTTCVAFGVEACSVH